MIFMEWIIHKEQKNQYSLVSKNLGSGSKEKFGLLPKGSYLTAELKSGNKVVLRVNESGQNEQYSPSPMIINMDLDPISADQKSQNILHASVVSFEDMRVDT